MNTNYLEKYSIFGRILQKSGKNTGETDADTKLVIHLNSIFSDSWSILPNFQGIFLIF